MKGGRSERPEHHERIAARGRGPARGASARAAPHRDHARPPGLRGGRRRLRQDLHPDAPRRLGPVPRLGRGWQALPRQPRPGAHHHLHREGGRRDQGAHPWRPSRRGPGAGGAQGRLRLGEHHPPHVRPYPASPCTRPGPRPQLQDDRRPERQPAAHLGERTRPRGLRGRPGPRRPVRRVPLRQRQRQGGRARARLPGLLQGGERPSRPRLARVRGGQGGRARRHGLGQACLRGPVRLQLQVRGRARTHARRAGDRRGILRAAACQAHRRGRERGSRRPQGAQRQQVALQGREGVLRRDQGGPRVREGELRHGARPEPGRAAHAPCRPRGGALRGGQGRTRGARQRRPAAAAGPRLPRAPRDRRRVRGQVPPGDGRRVPGHQRPAGRHGQGPLRRGCLPPHHGGRRPAGHLRLPRRRRERVRGARPDGGGEQHRAARLQLQKRRRHPALRGSYLRRHGHRAELHGPAPQARSQERLSRGFLPARGRRADARPQARGQGRVEGPARRHGRRPAGRPPGRHPRGRRGPAPHGRAHAQPQPGRHLHRGPARARPRERGRGRLHLLLGARGARRRGAAPCPRGAARHQDGPLPRARGRHVRARRRRPAAARHQATGRAGRPGQAPHLPGNPSRLPRLWRRRPLRAAHGRAPRDGAGLGARGQAAHRRRLPYGRARVGLAREARAPGRAGPCRGGQRARRHPPRPRACRRVRHGRGARGRRVLPLARRGEGGPGFAFRRGPGRREPHDGACLQGP